ncbi:MAG: DUF3592 domain-containing protein [Methylacidiphilales bacterium]|nr:DUF3592 domain-containing protein [Candidatus Methylacidiphilales bacterium]
MSGKQEKFPSITASDSLPADGRIKGSEKGTLIGAWVGTVFFGFLILLLGWHMNMPLLIGKMPNPVLAIMALVFLFLLVKSIRETIRLKRFGDPALELNRVPVPMGEILEGRITLGTAFMTGPDFHAKLQCVHRWHENAGKNSHDREVVLWSGETKTALMPGGVVPVSIALPDNRPATNDTNPFDRIFWRLTVTAPFTGIGFAEKYEIPVEAGAKANLPDPIKDDAPFGGPTHDLTPNQATGNMIFMGIFTLAALAAGLYFLSFAVTDITRANASLTWPVTSGHIVESTIGWKKNAPYPQIIYAYNVNGVMHSGETVYPHWFWTRKASQRLLDQFPVGAVVSVHYSPTVPDDPLLQPGLQPGVFQGLLVSTLLLSFALLLGITSLSGKYAVSTGSTVYYKKDSPAGKWNGRVLLLMILQGVLLWWVTVS